MGVKRQLENALGSVLGKAYYCAKVQTQMRKTGGDPMLVWQMGKVGSSTIYASLADALPAAPLFHIHMLTEQMLLSGEHYKKAKKKGHKAFEYNRCLRDALLKSLESGQRWKIVSVVREPVGRNLSAFFENLDLYFDAHEVAPGALKDLSVERLIDTFLKEADHERPMKWFDGEINGLLGLNVFDEEFDKQQGYQIYKRDMFDMLVIRMEDINTKASTALAQFLGLSEFSLINRNVGSDKNYATEYKEVKAKIRFSPAYLDNCYGSEFSRHFYTDEEILKFRKRWETN